MLQACNAELVGLYWRIGQRIRRHILQEKRAEYGQEIVAALSQQLTREFGRGFTTGNLSRGACVAVSCNPYGRSK